MNEETLTEIALYEIARRHQSGELVVISATKQQEAIHGGDWLWWFVSRGQGVSYRVQAKRLYASGRYESLYKTGKDAKGNALPKDAQIKKLIDQSKKDGHTPLYCFYNFQHPDGDFWHSSDHCAHTYHAPSIWGCSIALAADVEFANSDRLLNLRQFMLPWHILTCVSPIKRLAQSAAEAGRKLAAPKGEPSIVGDSIEWSRPQRDLTFSERQVPKYVEEIINIQREKSSMPIDYRRQEMDIQANQALDANELTGLAIFQDDRN